MQENYGFFVGCVRNRKKKEVQHAHMEAGEEDDGTGIVKAISGFTVKALSS